MRSVYVFDARGLASLCCEGFTPAPRKRWSVGFSSLIVAARDLAEAAEGAGLLGVRVGRFSGGITREPETIS